MAIIPGVLSKLLEEQFQQTNPIAESVGNQLGANINALIDINTSQEFTSGGTYNIPLNATHLLIAACGGGGGGCGGFTDLNFAVGAQGGGGSPLVVQLIKVTGGETGTVAIGAGGAGGASGTGFGNPGANGGDTTFSNATDGVRTWFGGKGGAASFNRTIDPTQSLFSRTRGRAFNEALGGFKDRLTSTTSASIPAGNTLYAGGSNGGDVPSGGFNRIGGGGGGAGSFGPGGNGASGTGSGTAPGGDAAATSYGSGGGACGLATFTISDNSGGDGAQGYLMVLRALTL